MADDVLVSDALAVRDAEIALLRERVRVLEGLVCAGVEGSAGGGNGKEAEAA